MPMPISTTLLVLAAIFVSVNSSASIIVGLVFGGVALSNEVLRAILIRQPSDGSYEIPAVPRERTIRNPITDETDAS